MILWLAAEIVGEMFCRRGAALLRPYDAGVIIFDIFHIQNLGSLGIGVVKTIIRR